MLSLFRGLPPQNEIAGLHSNQDQQPRVTENPALQVDDLVCLKKERNEIGALVVNINFLKSPQIGTIMRVLDEETRETSAGRRKYVVKLHHFDCKAQTETHSGINEATLKTGESSIVGDEQAQSESLREDREPALPTPLGLFSRRQRQPNVRLSSNEQIWSSDEFVFLGESAAVIGKVVALDGQFAVIRSVNNAEPIEEGLKVHFIKSLEKVTEFPSMQGPSKRNVTRSTRYEKVMVVSPRCIVDPLGDKSKYKGHKAVAIATGCNGITLLLNRLSDSKTFLVLPENVRENNSKMFTNTKIVTGAKDNMLSEGCVTVEAEAVPAEHCNLDIKEVNLKSTTSIGTSVKIGSKRNADCMSGADNGCHSSDMRADRLTKPQMFSFEKPNCTLLLDRMGCPFPVKFGTCLQQSSMLECGPFNVVEFTQTGYGCDKDEKIITAVIGKCEYVSYNNLMCL